MERKHGFRAFCIRVLNALKTSLLLGLVLEDLKSSKLEGQERVPQVDSQQLHD
jgi:hypothetical protein